jgi:SAM-dependent methyltransferase
MASKGVLYEQEFHYSKGSLDVTPRDWFWLAWGHFRREISRCMSEVVKKNCIMVIVGVGESGFVPREGSMWTIGIDINRTALAKTDRKIDLVIGSASHLPLKENSVDLVYFELVLHHLKGQMSLSVPFSESYKVLVPHGRMIAVEPNMLHPSGFLLNLLNVFHLYASVFGGSNYEYSLTAKELTVPLSRFSGFEVEALSFYHPRFPLFLQRYIMQRADFLKKHFSSFAWMILVRAVK